MTQIEPRDVKAGKPPPGHSRSKKPSVRAAKSKASPGRAPSGRVHLYVGLSLDGYIAAPDGGVDWLNPYADAPSGFAPFIKTIGSAVMGRVTYAGAHGHIPELRRRAALRTPRPVAPPYVSP